MKYTGSQSLTLFTVITVLFAISSGLVCADDVAEHSMNNYAANAMQSINVVETSVRRGVRGMKTPSDNFMMVTPFRKNVSSQTFEMSYQVKLGARGTRAKIGGINETLAISSNVTNLNHRGSRS